MATQSPPPPTANKYRAASALLALQAARAAQAARPKGLAALAQAILRYQIIAATFAERAVGVMLADQRIEAPPQATLNLPAFTTSPLTLERMTAKTETDAEFERLVASITQETARAVQQAAVAVRPEIGWVRHLTLPSCSRCAVLAGRVYRWSDGFLRHPNCFPAGTVVSGPGARGATRRWYEGELVVISTSGGKDLSVTANHPILTDQGWLPANLLTEGGYVISRASGDRSGALLVPDHDQMPSRIEDLWSADSMSPLGRMPVATEDFHGDGASGGHVDVVLADGLLGNRQEIAILKQLSQELFALRIELAVALDATGSSLEFGLGPNLAADGALSLLGLSGPLAGRHLGGTNNPGLAWMTDRHFGLDQAASNGWPANSGAIRDGVLTLAPEVRGHDLGGWDVEPSPTRWDAPPGALSGENSGAYAARGKALLERLSGNVERDRIVELRRVSFSGHVYNLSSDEGWYDANGLIVSNCDCTMTPTSENDDSMAYDVEDLARSGQVTGLSKADRQALDDGADFGQLVNVRSRKAGLTESGRVLARAGRPTPEGIYRMASDRAEALELLRQHGYLR